MNDREKLPEPLREAAAELRETPLPPGLRERMFAELARADQLGERTRPAKSRPRVMSWAWAAPTMASLAVAFYLTHDRLWMNGLELDMETRTLNAELDPTETRWLDLDLVDHHHAGDVHLVVHAPEGVHVRASEETQIHAEVMCADEVCRHEFRFNPRTDGAPVAIGLREPGQYRVAVEHRSQAARLREEFLVHARHAD